MVLVERNPPANAGDWRDVGSIPASGRSPGGGQGNPLQYSCLQNPKDRGAWQATVHGITKSQILLKWLSTYTYINSVQFNRSVVSDSLWPHGLQHTRLPRSSTTPGAYSNSHPLHQWCHETISSSVIPFSSHLQSFPTSGSFQMSQFFASGGPSIGVSASESVLPMHIRDWSPLEWTGWISSQSKELSRVFSNTAVQKHQFFGAQLFPYIWNLKRNDTN